MVAAKMLVDTRTYKLSSLRHFYTYLHCVTFLGCAASVGLEVEVEVRLANLFSIIFIDFPAPPLGNSPCTVGRVALRALEASGISGKLHLR